MSNHEHELNEELSTTIELTGVRLTTGNSYGSPQPASPQSPAQPLDVCQWQIGANGTFRPGAATRESLPAGSYVPRIDQLGPYLQQHPVLSDDVIELPESANVRVLTSIRKFWQSSARYNSRGLLFKRGILLWGPPGSGKTVTVHLLTRDLIASGGIVLFADAEPYLVTLHISNLRKIEPDRPLIVVYEDLDEIIARYAEHEILSLLDGENQTANVVNIATTNYPARLGARIVNRPSRFDERIHVGMPSAVARATYLAKVVGGEVDELTLGHWVDDTDGFSVAHLREMVAAVLCLDQPYDDVLDRLRSMAERPKEDPGEGFRARKVGLA